MSRSDDGGWPSGIARASCAVVAAAAAAAAAAAVAVRGEGWGGASLLIESCSSADRSERAIEARATRQNSSNKKRQEKERASARSAPPLEAPFPTAAGPLKKLVHDDAFAIVSSLAHTIIIDRTCASSDTTTSRMISHGDI